MRQDYEIDNLAQTFMTWAKTDPNMALGMLTGEEVVDAIKIIALAQAKFIYEQEHKPTYWVMP